MKVLHTGRKTAKQLLCSHIGKKFFVTGTIGILGHPLHLVDQCSPHNHQQQPVAQKNSGWINSFLKNIIQCVGYREDFSDVILSSSNISSKRDYEVRSVDMSSSGVYKHLLESMQGLRNNDSSDECSKEDESNFLVNNSIWQCSTMRKRKSKMNKHKLKKRRKKLRMNTKQTRN